MCTWLEAELRWKRGLLSLGKSLGIGLPESSQMLQFSNKVVSIFSQGTFKYSGRFFSSLPIVKLIITYLLVKFQMRYVVDCSADEPT